MTASALRPAFERGSRPRWRAALALPFAAALLASPAAANDDPAPSAVHSYHIPVQPLNTALSRFAETSGVDVLVDESDAAGRRSAPVVGVFGPPQALRSMLDGTGLVARFTSRRSAVISRADRVAAADEAAPPAYRAGNVIVLDRMEVRATRLIGAPRQLMSGRFIADMASQIRDIMVTARVVGKGADSRMRIQTRIRPDGTLHDVRVAIASADPARDARIVALLEGARLDLAPPEGMPQPLRFDVAGR
ncbi:STN domain-containing protein [Sandaracinobacter sp. RS1-74]|uniref:STN domain-containing protein n=1 Tax=Sandaracinobacteroides sayramensis TaxID=2913411 RepID=UPI001EDBB0F4|nr:STN domain-containing protein [Sandaracinobacteroides sayramensis]MCG2841373.1 STN domain-containing protein [Sandaracinobacteroides sayramensis]